MISSDTNDTNGTREQLGKSRTRKELLEGWLVEGSDYQPGLLDILKSSRTPEVS